MALVDLPDAKRKRLEHACWNVAYSLIFGLGVAWVVLVWPDPGPLVALPALAGVAPSGWLPAVLFTVAFLVLVQYRGFA